MQTNQMYALIYTSLFNLLLQDIEHNYFIQIAEIANETATSILNQHEKYRKALTTSHSLASLASEVEMKEFDVRLQLLKDLEGAWLQGKKPTLVFIDDVHGIQVP